MKAPYYIVSDNHFCMDDSDFEQKRRKKLFDIFEKIKQLGGTLIIGGDFFDYWFEYDNVIPKGYESILSSFCDMTKNNIDIHYVLGNHDYWDFGYLEQKIGLVFHKKDLKFNFNNNDIDNIISNLDYSLTLSQKNVLKELQQDFSSGNPSEQQ